MIDIIPNWHPAFVHFPLALLIVATAALLLSLPATKTRREALEFFAHWNLRLGFGFALITVWLGWLAYQSVAHDGPAHAAMTRHRDAAFLTVGLWTPLFLASWYHRRWRAPVRVLFAAGALVAAIALARTGWLGAEAVYRHGLGVMRLPAVTSEGHDHHAPDAASHGHDAAPGATAPPASPEEHNGTAAPHHHDGDHTH